MEVIIREAAAEDLLSIYQLICEMEETSLPEETFSCGYETISTDQNHTILVAELDGQVIGMIHIRMEFQLHHAAKIAEIMELAVQEDFRSQGIGRQLLTSSVQIAKKHLCEQIEVSSHKNEF